MKVVVLQSSGAVSKSWCYRAQELCQSRGGRPGFLLVPNSPYGLCGRKATLELERCSECGTELLLLDSKIMFVTTKKAYFCRDKHVFVATTVLSDTGLSRQK